MKNMLMAGLMMVAASLVSCTTRQQYVIEGTLTGVEEGTEIQLFKNDEKVLTPIASTQLENGQFRFEMEVKPDTSIFVQLVVGWNYGSLPRLWVAQGTHTTIKGEGWDYTDWDIQGGAAEQMTENHIVEATRSFRKSANESNNKFITRGWEKLDKEKLQSRIHFTQRGVAFSIEDVPLRNAILDALKELPVDHSWIVNYHEASRSINEDVRKKGQLLYTRLNDEQRNTPLYGELLRYRLFPSNLVNVGDELADATLYDIEGNIHHLKDFHGKYLLLDFWYSGCQPCLKAIPELKRIEAESNGQIVTVSISSDDVETWKNASLKLGITGNNFNDHRKNLGIIDHYINRDEGYPQFYLASPDGIIIAAKSGYREGSLTGFVKDAIEKHENQNKK